MSPRANPKRLSREEVAFIVAQVQRGAKEGDAEKTSESSELLRLTVTAALRSRQYGAAIRACELLSRQNADASQRSGSASETAAGNPEFWLQLENVLVHSYPALLEFFDKRGYRLSEQLSSERFMEIMDRVRAGYEAMGIKTVTQAQQVKEAKEYYDDEATVTRHAPGIFLALKERNLVKSRPSVK